MIKRILVVNEKHGSRYFDASTDEMLARVSLKILTERFKEGWYDYELTKKEEVLSEDQIKALPTEQLRRQEAFRRRQFLLDERDDKQNEDFYNEVKSIVDKDSSTIAIDKAWSLLASRSDYEYEEVELITLEE